MYAFIYLAQAYSRDENTVRVRASPRADAVLGTFELERRVLTFAGPRWTLLARRVSWTLARAWAPESVAFTARAGAWSACLADLEEPVSLHSLLAPFCRRTAGLGSRCGSAAQGPSVSEYLSEQGTPVAAP